MEEGDREEQTEIVGGYIGDFEELSFHEPKHRAQTAKLLALTLVWILAVTILVHYTATAVLSYAARADAVEALNKIFNGWLPVVSAAAGSATMRCGLPSK